MYGHLIGFLDSYCSTHDEIKWGVEGYWILIPDLSSTLYKKKGISRTFLYHLSMSIYFGLHGKGAGIKTNHYKLHFTEIPKHLCIRAKGPLPRMHWCVLSGLLFPSALSNEPHQSSWHLFFYTEQGPELHCCGLSVSHMKANRLKVE